MANVTRLSTQCKNKQSLSIYLQWFFPQKLPMTIFFLSEKLVDEMGADTALLEQRASLQAGEMKIIRTFIFFNSVVRSDEAQHRCYGGLPITVQPYFSLLSPSSPTTPQVIIEEQRTAICPCLLSAPCGCACLCVRVCLCVCVCVVEG